MNEREIFEGALELPDPQSRQVYLTAACAGNSALRQQIEELLALHAASDDFLSVPAIPQMTGKATFGEKTGAGIINSKQSEPTLGHSPIPLQEDDDVLLEYLTPLDKPGVLGRLGHYEVQDILGRGAFGIVLKAFDENLHRLVAIKILSPTLAKTSPPRKRFLREARSAAAIRHENVVAIHAVEDQPIPYLVMEYIPGVTLEQTLNEHGPLDIAEVVGLGQQIATGLAAAHAQGLIHRDIKPSNILLENGLSGRVKLTDFGLARTVDDANVTQSGTILGTPMYMSPEQAQCGNIDQRSDLFSLGSVLYRMVSGRPPFRAANTLAVLKRVVEDTPRPIPTIIPDTPDWLCAMIAKLHAKSPEERFSSAKEVADLLGSCLADWKANRPVTLPAGIFPSPESSEKWPSEPTVKMPRTSGQRRSIMPKWSIAVVVLFVLFAGVSFTEATGVTQFTATVIRLTTGSGMLVIETDDPNVKVTIDGEAVQVHGAGIEQLTLKPGQYQIAALKDGHPVKQELVTITRGGKQVVKVSLEGIVKVDPPVSHDAHRSELPSAQPSTIISPPGTDADRRAAEWVLSSGGTVTISVAGKDQTVQANGALPTASFQLTLFAAGRPMTDADLAHFAGCRNLVGLNLEQTSVTDAGLDHVQGCKNLTHLCLNGTAVSDVGLANFDGCHQLIDLQLNRTQVTDAGLAHFASNPALTGLHLAYNNITDAGLAHFRPCRSLEVLNLSSTNVTDAGMENFRGARELGILSLDNTKVTDAGLANFRDCRRLLRLNLDNLGMTDAGWANFKDCTELRDLTMYGAKISDDALAPLARCMNLTYLLLDQTPVSDIGLAHLATCVNLERLHLDNTQITDEGLHALQKCSKLAHLTLYKTKVGNVGLEHLRHLKDLTWLNLQKTAVTDPGLKSLSELRKLHELNLSETEVTAAGLSALSPLENLRILNVRKTDVTAAGIESLQKTLPNCKIDW